MTRIFSLLLFIGLACGQQEWIYYNYYGLLISESATHRIRPDNSNTELYMDGLSLLDIYEDEETFLYESYNNIYKVNSSTIDTLELQTPFYYARFTQIENEIIYYKPTIGQWGKDKIYKYSFNDNETTLLADSLYRFANPHSLMSPSKDKFAYFKSDFSNSGYYQLYVIDIQSGQELGIKSNLGLTPSNYLLSQNFPNPFNPITTIRYELPEDSFVDVTVYDMLGNVVKNLVNTNQSSGYKSVQWDATNNQGEPVSAGVYLYRIQAGNFIDTKKMIFLK